MPHTNRKKKSNGETKPKFIQTKRQLLDDDEGWTHVVDAKKASVTTCLRDNNNNEGRRARTLEKDFIVGSTAIVTMDIKEMEAEHTRFRQQWEASDACSKLKTLVRDSISGLVVKKVVSLGLGSFQNCFFHARRTSHTQFAALQTIVQALDIQDLRLLAQEPNTTVLDKEFLKSMKFESVDDPSGVEQIDSETLVFAVHCYADLYSQVGKQPQAAVLIASDVERHIENVQAIKTRTTDDETKLGDLKNLVTGTDIIPFPQIRYDFSDTSIYLKATAGKMEDKAEVMIT